MARPSDEEIFARDNFRLCVLRFRCQQIRDVAVPSGGSLQAAVARRHGRSNEPRHLMHNLQLHEGRNAFYRPAARPK